MQSDSAEEDLDDSRALVISDLFSQVNVLNSKLIQSYDHVLALEETLDNNAERLRALEREVMNLEMEMEKPERTVKDGRLVERSAVAAELSRYVLPQILSTDTYSPFLTSWKSLQPPREPAEAKHKQMESELPDLSTNLFNAASEMVATEHQAYARVKNP